MTRIMALRSLAFEGGVKSSVYIAHVDIVSEKESRKHLKLISHSQ